MAFKVTWKPVLQALSLKDYHPEFGDNVIMVCVNPKSEFLAERISLLAEYQRRLFEVQVAAQKQEDRQKAELLAQSFSSWCESEFLAGMQGWFARLWSFGEDQWSADDVTELDRTDQHLVTWLKRRSIEMIDEHRAGRKKA